MNFQDFSVRSSMTDGGSYHIETKPLIYSAKSDLHHEKIKALYQGSNDHPLSLRTLFKSFCKEAAKKI